MKRILLFMTVLMVAVCMVSCNSFENNAKSQLSESFKMGLINPESAKIYDLKTVFSNDSICIIEFRGSGTNSFGGTISHNYEYIYLNHQNSDGKYYLYEYMKDLDDSPKYKPFSETLKTIRTTEHNEYEYPIVTKMQDYNLTKEEAISDFIYHLASIQCLIHGRKIENE